MILSCSRNIDRNNRCENYFIGCNVTVKNQSHISHIEAQIETSRGWSTFTAISKQPGDSATYQAIVDISEYLLTTPIGGQVKIRYRIFDWRDKSMIITEPEILIKN